MNNLLVFVVIAALVSSGCAQPPEEVPPPAPVTVAAPMYPPNPEVQSSYVVDWVLNDHTMTSLTDGVEYDGPWVLFVDKVTGLPNRISGVVRVWDRRKR